MVRFLRWGTNPLAWPVGRGEDQARTPFKSLPHQPQSPQETLKHLLPAQISPIILSLHPSPACSFPIQSPVGEASAGLAMELAESEEPEGHAQAVLTPGSSDWGFILL